MDPSTLRTRLSPSDVPTAYRPLHKYLSARFADTVVLTFGQIEDLIGCALPGRAYSEPAWWLDPSGSDAPSPQSNSWRLADRIATANLVSRTVMFDRA